MIVLMLNHLMEVRCIQINFKFLNKEKMRSFLYEIFFDFHRDWAFTIGYLLFEILKWNCSPNIEHESLGIFERKFLSKFQKFFSSASKSWKEKPCVKYFWSALCPLIKKVTVESLNFCQSLKVTVSSVNQENFSRQQKLIFGNLRI